MNVRYWALWFNDRLTPRYEVFRYQGFEPGRGLYYFRSIETGRVLARGYYQLNAYGFIPFLIDTKRLPKE